jgi:hypothetical protein
MYPKLLVVGHARHGKDTVCDILKTKHNLSFKSSSMFCAELFIFDALKSKYNYKTVDDCFLDRYNHRAEWYNLIHEYCSSDYAKLGKEIFAKYNIYCGLRNKKEFHAMKNANVFDYCIWVDRSEHLSLEEDKSMTLEPWMADYVIDNNDTLEQLVYNTDQVMLTINKHFYAKVFRM